MSNFVQEFEEDEQLQSTIISQSSNGSPSHVENCGAGGGSMPSTTSSKKKRNLPGNPDPDAEVVALSPRTLMATNRYMCEVCHKGFQRDQNLQLHRRGHNLPWKLKQRPTTQVKKRVYVCPEINCVHHDPSRALGDLTGIKKHFCRKHGEKKWKCDKCSKRYAVQSDWKAHTKICGTREYRCDCGTIFSRKDSFVTHRAFCDALTEENYKVNHNLAAATGGMLQNQAQELFTSSMPSSDSAASYTNTNTMMNLSISTHDNMDSSLRPLSLSSAAGVMISTNLDPLLNPRIPRTNNVSSMVLVNSAFTSATALLQKAAEMGAKISDSTIAPILLKGFSGYSTSNMTSSGSIQEGSMLSGSCSNMATATSNLYVESGDPRQGYNISQAALFEPHPQIMQSENGNLEEEMYMGGNEKMTLDFLGVEPGGYSGIGKKRSNDGNLIEFGGYQIGQHQQSLQNLQSNW
ncbi:zinc finger protein GAI-ASSOCIATED FACTOR 1-like [Mangifera indica]|uniref:zinc finger protein GAI-ASSOCIATED FACTOR 1-like n=1 Tax=Mangifera indica TaxID=29780 RepID=UPI001CFA3C52|nr:zinc finger protein GAI-ASSOCIATED FACTOR 1-like [Mangifera indica]